MIRPYVHGQNETFTAAIGPTVLKLVLLDYRQSTKKNLRIRPAAVVFDEPRWFAIFLLKEAFHMKDCAWN
jgi:hypothetical protein